MNHHQATRAEDGHFAVQRQAGGVDANNAGIQRHGGLRYRVVAQGIGRNRFTRFNAKKACFAVHFAFQAACKRFVCLGNARKRVTTHFRIGGKRLRLNRRNHRASHIALHLMRAVHHHALQYLNHRIFIQRQSVKRRLARHAQTADRFACACAGVPVAIQRAIALNNALAVHFKNPAVKQHRAGIGFAVQHIIGLQPRGDGLVYFAHICAGNTGYTRRRGGNVHILRVFVLQCHACAAGIARDLIIAVLRLFQAA